MWCDANSGELGSKKIKAMLEDGLALALGSPSASLFHMDLERQASSFLLKANEEFAPLLPPQPTPSMRGCRRSSVSSLHERSVLL